MEGHLQTILLIIKLLMDRTFRKECMGVLNEKAMNASLLKDLDKSTLEEICIISRAGPEIPRVKEKGHLGVGADDVTIYDMLDDKEQMLAHLVM